ncbi:hypothetical protein [Mycobacterium sp. NPDC004974]
MGTGGVATVVVGVAAVVVSTIFNILTLRQSRKNLRLAQQAFDRTEQKYEKDRIDARNDRLRVALVALQTAIERSYVPAMAECELANRLHGETIERLRRGDCSEEEFRKSFRKLCVATAEGLNPATAELMAEITNLTFLAMGIDELMDPLETVTGELNGQWTTIENDGPLNAAPFFERARSLKEERDRVMQANVQLYTAAMVLFSSHEEGDFRNVLAMIKVATHTKDS